MTPLGSLARRVRYAPRTIGYVRGPRLMSWLRKRWVLMRNPHATIEFADSVYLGPGFSLHMPDGGTFIAGPNVEFRRNFRAEMGGDAVITIGANVRFTYDVLIQCSTALTVGEGAGIGQCVFIADGNHEYKGTDSHWLEQGYAFRPIEIGAGAGINSKSTVLNNVGERAWVGANAVVTRPVPAWTVCVGVPARPIEYFGPPGGEPPELLAQAESSG